MLNNDILNVMRLQQRWTAHKTPEMTERGELIRGAIEKEFRAMGPQIAAQLRTTPDALIFEGRDNTGRYSKVPWVRFAIEERSPSATAGWYCVLLFNTYGTGAYLCLSHGSNNYVSGSFQKKSAAEIRKLMQWGRTVLAPQIASGKYETKIDLGDIKGSSAEAYPDTTVLARYYDGPLLAAGVDIGADMIEFAGLLHKVYEQESLGLSPDETLIQFEEAQDALASFFEPRSSLKSARQGFGLTTAEKKVVELHAMAQATAELKRLGYTVEDCSAKRSYDLVARRAGQELIVEVKGTTGHGEAVILTYREVIVQRETYPLNCLIVVHSIKLDRSGEIPNASGGHLVMFQPWLIEDSQLKATGYQYTCPSAS